MKYPKEWVEAVQDNMGNAEHILNALSYNQALKDPPKPREWWMCDFCHVVAEEGEGSLVHDYSNCEDRGRVVHVQEVLTSSEN